MENNGFVIFDCHEKQPYILVLWPSKSKAQYELNMLLKGFDEDNPWRNRLAIRPTNEEINKRLAVHASTKVIGRNN